MIYIAQEKQLKILNPKTIKLLILHAAITLIMSLLMISKKGIEIQVSFLVV